MADYADALEGMRKICLALPGATESSHFGSRMFKASGKGFASCGPEGIVVKLEPDHHDALVDSDPRFTRYPRMKSLTVLALDGIRDWDEVRALVHESHRLNTTTAKPTSKSKPRATAKPKPRATAKPKPRAKATAKPKPRATSKPKPRATAKPKPRAKRR